MVVEPPAGLSVEGDSSPVQVLEKRVGGSWPSFSAASARAQATRDRLGQALESVGSSEVSVVVHGSLARDEFTDGSDVDWTLLVDGPADYHHLDVAHDIEGLLDELKMKRPSREGAFGNMTFSHDLIHQIGGEDDRNSNTTRRILLLLESVALVQPAVREKVITGILSRYVFEEPTFAQGTKKPRVPRFLLNDFARYWRTMAVDFANKARTRFGKGAALRNLKLRMSRKLIFVSGLLSCFSCDLKLGRLSGTGDCTGQGAQCVNCLRAFMRRKPLEAFAHAALVLADRDSAKTAAILAAAAQSFQAYDRFLALLSDKDKRSHLEELSAESMDSDSVFNEGREMSHDFRDGLDSFFFEGHPDLAKLTRQYGVF
jgi:predicted nucleotidyltransferase